MILDLYAGPGGWEQGLATLGITDVVGVESDRDVCATRRAAGHRTIQADATTLPIRYYEGRAEGLVASPPCQEFSQAGTGIARADLELTAAILREGHPWWGPDTPASDGARHILTVGEWIEHTRPGWICLEQVPPVLPLWEAMADWLRQDGYHVWCGVLCAADYGVPQTRRRAVLIASRHGPVRPPEPTHAEHPQPDLWGDAPAPWVTMADALGWPEIQWGWVRPDGQPRQHTTTAPAPTIHGACQPGWAGWAWTRPATTVAGDPRCHKINADDRRRRPDADQRYGGRAGARAIRLTETEALILQGFPPDYRLAGRTRASRWSQIGNAVPPPLAAAMIAAAAARPLDREAA